MTFEVVRQGGARSCVEPPQVMLAQSEDDWIDIFDFETDCTGASDVPLPEVDFASGPVVAIWVERARCRGDRLRVAGVRKAAARITVAVETASPDPCAPLKDEQVLEAFVQLTNPDAMRGVSSISVTMASRTLATLQVRPHSGAAR